MALKLSDRYSSPQILADDIEHYLADEPVSAFLEPVTVRARRWARKHQTLTVTTAAVLLVSAVGLGTFSTIVSSKNADLKTSNDQLATANGRERDARTLAETNEESARDQSQLDLSTLTSVITDIQGGLTGVPGSGEVRRRLLKTALEKLESVSTQYLAQSAVDRNTWSALNHMGDVILQFGTEPTVAPSLRRRELSSGPPESEPTPTEQRSAVQLAESYYQRAFQIAKTLAEADPNNAEKQRDLSISFNKLGDVFLKLGRTDDALTQFQDGLKISRVLAEADPDDTWKQRELSTSIERIGVTFEQLGIVAAAQERYVEMLAIKMKLAEADPSDSVAQRELGVAYNHLGDVFLTLDRPDDALTQFQDGLKIRRVLAEADPHDAQKQRDLSVSFERLGDVFRTLGRTDDALTQYQAYEKLCRVLAEADPSDAEKQRDLMFSHYSIGTGQQALDQFSLAAKSFDAAAAILHGMIERGMNVERSTSELTDMESFAQTARLEETAIGDWEKLLQQPAESLPAVLDLRGIQFTKRSRFTEAAQAAAKLRELETADNGQLYNAACVFSLCAASINAADGSELTAEQVAQRQTWINEALASLKQSIDKGWTDFVHMQQDPDLTILRDLPEFRSLIPASSPM